MTTNILENQTVTMDNSFLSESDKIAVASPIKKRLIAMNSELSAAGVGYEFRTHYVNSATDKHGIKNLIAEILHARRAEFKAGSENGLFRELVVKGSMYSSDIIDCVRFIFGYDRYPDTTILTYLTSVEHEGGIMFQNVQLTAQEDSERDCCRPRNKFYLIAD